MAAARHRPERSSGSDHDCPVCMESDRPMRHLLCNHVLCEPCLSRIMERGDIPCPVCRHKTTVPGTKISNLPLHQAPPSASTKDDAPLVDSLLKEVERAHAEIQNLRVAKHNLQGKHESAELKAYTNLAQIKELTETNKLQTKLIHYSQNELIKLTESNQSNSEEIFRLYNLVQRQTEEITLYSTELPRLQETIQEQESQITSLVTIVQQNDEALDAAKILAAEKLKVTQKGMDFALTEKFKLEERYMELEMMAIHRESELQEIIKTQQQNIDEKTYQVASYEDEIKDRLSVIKSNDDIHVLKRIIQDKNREINILTSRLKEEINNRQILLKKANYDIGILQQDIAFVKQNRIETSRAKEVVPPSVEYDKSVQTDKVEVIAEPVRFNGLILISAIVVLTVAFIISLLLHNTCK